MKTYEAAGVGLLPSAKAGTRTLWVYHDAKYYGFACTIATENVVGCATGFCRVFED